MTCTIFLQEFPFQLCFWPQSNTWVALIYTWRVFLCENTFGKRSSTLKLNVWVKAGAINAKQLSSNITVLKVSYFCIFHFLQLNFTWILLLTIVCVYAPSGIICLEIYVNLYNKSLCIWAAPVSIRQRCSYLTINRVQARLNGSLYRVVKYLLWSHTCWIERVDLG